MSIAHIHFYQKKWKFLNFYTPLMTSRGRLVANLQVHERVTQFIILPLSDCYLSEGIMSSLMPWMSENVDWWQEGSEVVGIRKRQRLSIHPTLSRSTYKYIQHYDLFSLSVAYSGPYAAVGRHRWDTSVREGIKLWVHVWFDLFAWRSSTYIWITSEGAALQYLSSANSC